MPRAPSPNSDTGPTGRPRFIVARYGGELTTKAPATRRNFVVRLTRNLNDALRAMGCEGKIQREHNRLFIEIEAGQPDLETLGRVFGLQSVALAEVAACESVEQLVREGQRIFSERVRGRRFAVRVRRVGDRARIPVERVALERALGSALIGSSAGVDLRAPDVALHIELMPGRAFFFHESAPGPAGLPLGVEGGAVALVSGGFDSVVAAWQLMKRGVVQDFVFCNLGGRPHQLEAMHVMKTLADRWCYGARPHLHAIDFDEVSRDLQHSTATRYWQVILKRLMLAAAERIAHERDAVAIITGDAVGQVSSQTLTNLMVISEVTSLPILRPLVGFNKDEILEIARRIGTYDLSAKVGEYCALVPHKPATRAALPVILEEESKLDGELLERAVAERGLFDLRTLDLSHFEAPELEAESIPEGAVVIDLRSKAAYQSWHYPDALFLDFPNALRAYPSLGAEPAYVLYCEFGLKSAHLADLMRARGLATTHFKGGLKALLRYAAGRGIRTPDL